MVKISARKKTVVVRKKAAIPKQPAPGLDRFGAAHARMLYDPCGAPLEESVYPGDRGYVNRFQANASYGVGAGATAWFTVIKPGNACSTNFDFLASSSTGSNLAFSSAAFPGASFLSVNASKTRCISFCIALAPNAAPNTCTGTIHFGLVNASTLVNGAPFNPDQLIQLTTERVSAASALMAPLEVKWSPGGFDDRYATQGALSDDDSDRNCLVVVGTGFPAASGVSYRMVTVLEWSPKGNLGITNDASSVGRSRNTLAEVTRALKQRDSSWWWSLGKKTIGVAKGAAAGYMAGGTIGALGGAIKFL